MVVCVYIVVRLRGAGTNQKLTLKRLTYPQASKIPSPGFDLDEDDDFNIKDYDMFERPSPIPSRGEMPSPLPSRGEMPSPVPSRGEMPSPVPSNSIKGGMPSPIPSISSRGGMSSPVPSISSKSGMSSPVPSISSRGSTKKTRAPLPPPSRKMRKAPPPPKPQPAPRQTSLNADVKSRKRWSYPEGIQPEIKYQDSGDEEMDSETSNVGSGSQREQQSTEWLPRIGDVSSRLETLEDQLSSGLVMVVFTNILHSLSQFHACIFTNRSLYVIF